MIDELRGQLARLTSIAAWSMDFGQDRAVELADFIETSKQTTKNGKQLFRFDRPATDGGFDRLILVCDMENDQTPITIIETDGTERRTYQKIEPRCCAIHQIGFALDASLRWYHCDTAEPTQPAIDPDSIGGTPNPNSPWAKHA